ncbi:MAG: HYR domain-containing protein, partial [Saprospiraceae bacterium]|nr:HYR domain-containing protein [Saprospiraceae bacterium]
MPFRSKKHAIGAFIIVAILFLSFSGQHPAGNTGAPGDGICSNCHGGGGGGFDGDIDISGIPSTVTPNTTYNVTMTLNASTGSPVRGGFQVVALQDANDNNAGDWTNNGGGSSLLTQGGREYFGHNPAQFFGAGTSVSWDADWTAPNIMDDVTFYAVGNLANGSGSGGDKIVVNTLTVTVMGTDPLDVTISNVGDVSCFDGQDGTAFATVSGGTPPYSYVWDNGEDEATAVELDAGNHDVTVTDDDGDSGVASIFISEPSLIEIDPDIEHVSCFDEGDGFVELNAFGGTGALVCEWSDGIGPGCIQADLESGLYFITITDDNNCEVIEEIEIFQPELLLLNMVATAETMLGNMDGSITSTPSGGTAPYNFNWSTGLNENGMNSTVDNLPGGLYFLTVVDQNDCETIESIIVEAGPGCDIAATPDISHISCNRDSTGMIQLMVTGATAPISYSWSNGDTTEILGPVPAGLYSVELNDANDCMLIINDLLVTEPDTLKAQLLSVTETSCADASDGEIVLNVSGGVGDYELTWSNGVTNDTSIIDMDTIVNIPDTLSGLMAGVYSFELLDGNNCFVTDTFTVSIGDTVAPTLILEQATIYLDSSGQAPPASFADIDAGSFDNCSIDSVAFETPSFDCDDILAFDFPVTLFDSAGNSTVGTANIIVIDTIAPQIDCSAIGNIVSNSCDTINYQLPVVTDNCNYELEMTEGLPSGSGFPAGETTVEYVAIDECGNTAICSFTVTVNIDLELTVITTDASCFGAMDGVIEASASGGTPPYTYSITGGSYDSLPSGFYSIMVIDATNCIAMETVSILEPAMIDLSLVETQDASCFGVADGAISLDVLPDLYSWDINGDYNMLAPGSYVVTVTDAGSGCTTTAEYIIEQPDELGIENVLQVNPSCYNDSDCVLEFDVVGGTGMTMISYDQELSMCDGEVIVIVEDENGCQYSETFNFIRPDSISIENVVITPSADFDNGSIEIDVAGGTVPYTFTWTNDFDGQVYGNDEDLFNVLTGDYTVEITDANGCISTFSFFVDEITSTTDLDLNDKIVRLSPNP